MKTMVDLISTYEDLVGYANHEAGTIKAKVELAEHEIEKLEKQTEKMKSLAEKWRKEAVRVIYPDWKDVVLKKMARQIADAHGFCYEVQGPAGLGSRCFITLFSDKDKRPIDQEHKLLIVQPIFEDDKLRFGYETGRKIGRYEKGTVGFENGLDNEVLPLPDDLEEIYLLFRDFDPIQKGLR